MSGILSAVEGYRMFYVPCPISSAQFEPDKVARCIVGGRLIGLVC